MARNTRTFSDINLLFTTNPVTGDILKKVDEEAIKASVKSLIMTSNYERPFHPEIGCQINSLLFENFNPVTREVMKKTVRDVINKFEPRVDLDDVIITDESDRNDISLEIRFRIKNSERPIVLKTILTRVR